MQGYILSLDQGTTSSRALIVDYRGNVIASAQKEISQIYPKPGWVEHDPHEILETQIMTAREAIARSNIGIQSIKAIGIANQRETVVLWDKSTGKPLYNAIVWQCRRSTEICSDILRDGRDKIIIEKTGLLVDPYFSGTKIKWLLENVSGLKEKARMGTVLFGTIDSWLLYNLIGLHKTDPSNASRTMLYDIHRGTWDHNICRMLDIPESILPDVVPSCCEFGLVKKQFFGKEIPVTAVLGDQQAALFGQACYHRGDIKNTYGTGCFVLLNTGKEAVRSKEKLLTTIAWDIGDGRVYALEGSVFIGGAVIQWLRDNLKIIDDAAQSDYYAQSVQDTGGAYFIPAFVGLGAPYWNPQVRGTIVGLTRGTSIGHIVRAALESVAYQTGDLIEAMKRDYGQQLADFKADGGGSVNTFLMQFQADILGIPVFVSEKAETTALGSAFCAGLGIGFWQDLNELRDIYKYTKKWHPRLPANEKNALVDGWRRAVQAATHYTID